jgi:hypothetical protein
MRPRTGLRRSRRVSRAVSLLGEAPSSRCPNCGRVTKTTSDGVCADCWSHKDGRLYGSPKPPPRWALRLANLLTLRRR